MAELVSMKLSKPEAKEQTKPQEPKGPRYPWGLRLNLDTDELKRLGLSDLDVGDEVVLTGYGKVESKRASADSEGKSESLEIQITDLAVEATQAKEEKARPRSILTGKKRAAQ